MTQTLKGFRDFLPETMRQRLQVVAKLRHEFELAGFEPLETPTLEYAELLLGKYGQEADSLLYTFADRGDRQVGLRYDQTVPTARVLGQYAHLLPTFFRRYQIQPVFRADKPQKGRFREFVQCDIDIFGSTSPTADAEILATTYRGFQALGLDRVVLQLNTRPQLVSTVEPFVSPTLSAASILQTLDKLDKLDRSEVESELVSKGMNPAEVEQLFAVFKAAVPSPLLDTIMTQAELLGVPQQAMVFTPTLARGLDYYTGMIFEAVIPNSGMGTLGGGGRYDNLVEALSSRSVPAVGMAFGFDRIVELLSDKTQTSRTLVLVAALDEASIERQLEITKSLREINISSLACPGVLRAQKAIKIALEHQATHLVIIGEAELSSGLASVRDMASRQQQLVSLEQLISDLSGLGS